VVSIIIVNYNTGPRLAAALTSIHNHISHAHEIIIVDNHSTDDSLERLPEPTRCTIVRETVNWGFAKACNIGAGLAKGQVLHFLNPDTMVTGELNSAYQQVEDELTPCLYATQIIDEHGHAVKANFAFPTFKNLYRMLFKTGEVAKWYIGASVLISKKLFQDLEGWSEDYWLYAEDQDLFYRAHLAHVPTVQLKERVQHFQGTSSKSEWSARQRLLRVESSGWLFARKFHLRLSYLVFRHLGFAKGILTEPLHTFLEFITLWQVLLTGRAAQPPS
jgi:GT2 family glycosyltransferase